MKLRNVRRRQAERYFRYLSALEDRSGWTTRMPPSVLRPRTNRERLVVATFCPDHVAEVVHLPRPVRPIRVDCDIPHDEARAAVIDIRRADVTP